ncbi:MAG: hypothetical protein HN368_11660, partial [Spirochaetales bacterium]|nr:hypothetical protein [Spirochaetales bacterium]
MRKFIIIFMLCILIPFMAGAQTMPALTEIDFSNAEITQSGPQSFYIRNVVLPDQTVSITISLNAEDYWEITEVIPEKNNAIPLDVVLDFSTVEAIDEDSIEIDWIIYNGGVLSGVLSLAADGISVSEMFSESGSFSDPTLDFPEALNDLLEGRDTSALEGKIAEVRTKYEAKLAALQNQYDSLSTERDGLTTKTGTLQAQIDSLKTDNSGLVTKNAALQTQVDSLKSDNSSLQKQIDKLKDDVNSLAGGTSSAAIVLDGNISIPEELAEAYIDKLATLQSEITSLQTQIAQTETALDIYATLADIEFTNFAKAISSLDSKLETGSSPAEIDLADLETSINQLKTKIDSYSATG